jgi:hypothetical protein
MLHGKLVNANLWQTIPEHFLSKNRPVQKRQSKSDRPASTMTSTFVANKKI